MKIAPLPVRLRYDTREEQQDKWTVFHIFTGAAVEIDGYLQIAMDVEESEDPADLLNYQESLKAADE
ncbi:MAG: hypothetical protein P0Y65_14565 [Candidatus Devosia phytovorans]|uniref:Uncharacterized protein n=1 Tax=Candidatus Devosia phytovorans TaxID=3121372 RepID=A0AAJ6AZ47_9HYPH|nr:hypothetical protein [Devosia sp.]WEK03411.1 MAG: hypothetical protein P0Y65_14565 [Devosia sp.]